VALFATTISAAGGDMLNDDYQFIFVLALCIVCGLGFAAMATWLMTRRGNTIRDIMESSQFKDAKALSVEVMDKLKVSTNVPIVALYVVAGLVAVGLPMYVSSVSASRAGSPAGGKTATLRGEIQNFRSLIAVDKGERVYATPADATVFETGIFTIPLPPVNTSQEFMLQSPGVLHPFQLRVRTEPGGKVTVYSGSEERKTKLEGDFVSLTKPLEMFRLEEARERAKEIVLADLKPSVPPLLGPDYADLPPVPLK
jgi:hypothetical protein